MLPTSKTVSIMLLLAITSVASGQEASVNEIPSRLRYEGSPDLPNGIAFYMALLSIDHSNTQFGPADPAYQVEQKLGLNNVESHAFMSQALTTFYLIKTDVRAEENRLACEFAGPNVSKKDQYSALQQMYDSHKAITDHYFEQTKANLDAETAERLQQWMDEGKLSTVYVEFDFEKADQISGRDSTVTLSRICERDN